MNWIVSAMGGLAVCLVFMATSHSIAAFRASRVDDSIRAGNSIISSAIGPWISAIASVLSERYAGYCEKLEQKLIHAGRPGGDLTGSEFLALLLMAIAAFIALLLVFFVTGSSLNFGGFVFLAILAAVLVFVGLAWLDNAVATRRIAISRDFPYFMDLAVMTLEAGSDFRETLEIYIKDNHDKALAEEFSITLSEMKMGNVFRESVIRLVDRVSAEEVQNSLRALCQGERMGTPIAQLFRDQADAIRFRRSQLAERAAEEMKVKLQGPAMMLMISVLLLILGPALINILTSDYF